MTPFLLIFVAALILASAATPVAKRIAPMLGIMDIPSGRKAHMRPTPLLGGAAIYVATIIALLIFGQQQEITQFFAILIGATLMSFCGLWDDRRPLAPALKMAAQIVAALVLYASGVAVAVLPNALLNFLVTVLWVVGITNAFNLLDNMDGLSGGVSAIAALFFMLLAITSGQVLVGSLSAALLGACVGFLLYNFNPASIFMGDSGSLFIGFVLASVGIKLRFPDHPTVVTWMIPLIVLGLPIFDTVLVSISRLRRGKNPLTTPGHDHVSHRFVSWGLSHRQAVLTVYVICSLLGLAALVISQAALDDAYLIGGAILVIASGALILMEADYIRRATVSAR